MVYIQTIVNIADNSGVKYLKCIKMYKKGNRHGASIGNIILGSIKGSITLKKTRQIDQKKLFKALIVRSKRKQKRFTGHFISFDSTAAVLLNVNNLPYGTRIIGPIAYELRFLKISKIISLANKIL